MEAIKRKLYQWIMDSLKHPKVATKVFRFTQSQKSRHLIPLFTKLYKIDEGQLLHPLSNYQTLSDFFTREIDQSTLKLNQNKNVYVSPVEATVKDYGRLTEDKQYFIKEQYYSFEELTGITLPSVMENNHFIILYLSPRNYHRFHAPIDGKYPLRNRLGTGSYPVNDTGTKYIDELFSKNHRVVFGMNEDLLVAVGAMNINSVIHSAGHEKLLKGEELGYFTFGSTVILFFMEKNIKWHERIKEGATVSLGEEIAKKYDD